MLDFNGKSFEITAYCDTGCDAPLSLSSDQARRYGMVPSERASDEIHPVRLADGKIHGAYLYSASLTIEERKFPMMIPVVEEDILLPQKEKKGDETFEGDEPLIGREIMDKFDVTFAGTPSPKLLHFEE